MTKFTKILWGGVIALTLTACTTDSVFEDIDQQTPTDANNDGSQYQTNSYTGGITADGEDDGLYKSPWNIDSLRLVEYQHISNLSEKGVYVRVTPYIGLAYYDGANDGVYKILGNNYNLANGNYPNLYANGKEYGDYVQGNPMVLANPLLFSGNYTHELYIKSREDHCPLTNIPVSSFYNLYGIGFNIVNNNVVQPVSLLGYPSPSAPPAGTIDEERLLRKFGKVFYYKVEFGNDPYNFDPEFYYIPLLEAEVDRPEWSAMGLTDAFNTSLYYNNIGISGGAGTYEIVVDPIMFQGNNFLQNKRSGDVFATNVFDSYGNNMRKIVTLPAAFKYHMVWNPTLGLYIPHIVSGAEPRAAQINVQ